jgi:predicted alpha-1,2-mannosidase
MLSKNMRHVYFYAKFSKPFVSYGIATDDVLQQGKTKAEGKNIKMYVQFNDPGEVLVTTGLSHVSAEGALKNLQTEVSEPDFKRIQKAAKTAWQTALSNFLVEGGAPPKPVQSQAPASIYSPYSYSNSGKKIEMPDFALLKQTAFITALYHTMLSPAVANDADGQYRINDKIAEARGFTFYDVSGFNNEYGARYPLLTLTDSKRTIDIIKSYIVSPAADSTANALIPLIVDAYAKGIKDFDAEQAYNHMKAVANSNTLGRDAYRKLGYVPVTVWGSVTKTLKYAYQDWCIAQMAKMLNKSQPEQAEYLQRAQNWKNLFNTKNSFIQSRVNGEFAASFDAAINSAVYSGGSAWQHVLAIPYDVDGLITTLGGKDKLEEKLDELISAEFQQQGTTISSYNYYIPYLYAFTNNPQKAQNYLNRLMRRYPSVPDGLPEDDRQGEVSAWYALNCLGVYNIAPGQNLFNIGLPQFDRTVLWLNNDKIFTILNSGASLGRQNIYIQGMNIDEKDYGKLYINYQDIAQGGDFEVFTGTLPNKLVMQALEKPVIKAEK